MLSTYILIFASSSLSANFFILFRIFRGCVGLTRPASAVVLLITALSTTSSMADDVFWGGISMRGGEGASSVYPITYDLLRSDVSGRKIKKQLIQHLLKNKERFTDIDLTVDLADGSAGDRYVLAIALGEEMVVREKIGDANKLLVSLFFEMLIVDFEELKVVSSVPINIERIDSSSSPFSDEEVSLIIADMMIGEDSQLLKVIDEKAGLVGIPKSSRSTIKVANVTIGEKAIEFLPKRLQVGSRYGNQVGHLFGSLLLSERRLALLPFSKDASNASMALVFQDGGVVNFEIPDPTFAIDLHLKGFAKVKSKKSTASEILFIYGAYVDSKVYEPFFKREYFSASDKKGASKVVPASNPSVDDFSVLSDALKGVMISTIQKMTSDKNLEKKVISKCEL
jgi:hypothetical protein